MCEELWHHHCQWCTIVITRLLPSCIHSAHNNQFLQIYLAKYFTYCNIYLLMSELHVIQQTCQNVSSRNFVTEKQKNFTRNLINTWLRSEQHKFVIYETLENKQDDWSTVEVLVWADTFTLSIQFHLILQYVAVVGLALGVDTMPVKQKHDHHGRRILWILNRGEDNGKPPRLNFSQEMTRASDLLCHKPAVTAYYSG